MFARMSRSGDHLDRHILEDDLLAAGDPAVDHAVVEDSVRSDDAGIGRFLQRYGAWCVIAVPMRQENQLQSRLRAADGMDVRGDQRARIEHRRLADEVRTRAVERERTGVRRRDTADVHGISEKLLGLRKNDLLLSTFDYQYGSCR